MLSYTIRSVFWAHKVNKKGTGPVMIAVTLSRKVSYFKTPFRIRPAEWKNNQVADHPNATLMNRAIRKQIDDMEADLLTRDQSGERVTGRALKAKAACIFDFIDQLKKNHSKNTIRRYNCEKEKLRNFGGDRLTLQDINTAFLRDFEAHERARGMAQNTLNTSLKWVKVVLNKAFKEGLLKTVPFYQSPKYVNPERIYLVEAERLQWLDYWREKKVSGNLYHTLTWFLFGCYTGLRYSDWSQFDYRRRVENDLLKLRAKKNGVWVVLPIGPTLSEIIEVVRYLPKPLSGDKTRAHLKILAGRMGCDKNITCHSSRHAAGAMFAQLGLSKGVTAELLGISEKVAGIYYHLSGVDILAQAAVLRTV